MLFKAENIVKHYDGNLILKNATLVVESGTCVSIMGESGSGKSTLLSILGLLQLPDDGVVEIDGRAASSLPIQKLSCLRQKIGMVFQRTRVVSSLTVKENILLPALLCGQVKFYQKRVMYLMELLAISEVKDFYPYQLSLGQLRRVAVARAALLQPPLILADEPSNDLDAKNAESVWQVFREAKAAGSGILVVTHDEKLASRSDKMLILSDGKLFSK